MEILSTGEKIKRARVYKGITLKELCSDEISISKMSCIENGKIKADSEVLQYISKKYFSYIEYTYFEVIPFYLSLLIEALMLVLIHYYLMLLLFE